MIRAAVAAAILFVAADAGAESRDDDTIEISPSIGLGFGGGATQIGAHTFAQVGARITAGVHVARFELTGAYETGSTNRGVGDELINGQRHRFALGAGVDVARYGGELLFGETQVGIGAAREVIAWEQGGLWRGDVFLSVDQSVVFRMPPPYGRPAIVGPRALVYRFGLQIIASRTPPLALQPRASTPPKPDDGELDLGFMLSMGLQFRR